MWKTMSLLFWLFFCLLVSTDASAACGDSRWFQDQKSASCYRIVTSPLTWEGARKDCRSLGGDLLVIGSKAEMTTIDTLQADQVNDELFSAWLGLIPTQNAFYTWKWLDETFLQSDITPWQQGESINFDKGEECAVISKNRTSSGLSLRVCIETLPYICEKPQNVQVRLVGGRFRHEGRVEVRRWNDEDWGTVCDDGFYDEDADVVCRQLNLGKGYALRETKRASGSIYLTDLKCVGNETNLGRCRSPGWGTVDDCNDEEGARVVCLPLGGYSGLASSPSCSCVPRAVLLLLLTTIIAALEFSSQP